MGEDKTGRRNNHPGGLSILGDQFKSDMKEEYKPV